ncbi:MAG TPA: hypothetical protein VGD62_09120 [Acidobacteriaceae bacterium]
MTLLDAPVYNARRARLIRNSIIGVLVLAVVAGICTWVFWDWPEQHRLNRFLVTVESGDLNTAFGQWNNDPEWRQHPERYKNYSFADFSKDWGIGSDYGQIHTHKIEITKTVGNGVVMGVSINGGKTPLFLRVDHKSKQIGFSPVELYVGPG